MSFMIIVGIVTEAWGDLGVVVADNYLRLQDGRNNNPSEWYQPTQDQCKSAIAPKKAWIVVYILVRVEMVIAPKSFKNMRNAANMIYKNRGLRSRMLAICDHGCLVAVRCCFMQAFVLAWLPPRRTRPTVMARHAAVTRHHTATAASGARCQWH
eukprot:6486402-Amphidinium_carterae.2